MVARGNCVPHPGGEVTGRGARTAGACPGRLLIAGVIRWGQAVNLIFDMHNDYGWAPTDERGTQAKGLKQLFNNQVVIITLDGESTRRRGAESDFEDKLGYDEIDPEDIAALRGSMNLTDAMIDAAYTLKKRWRIGWIKRLNEATEFDFDDITMNTNIAEGTLLGPAAAHTAL